MLCLYQTETTSHATIELACQLYYEMIDESKTWPAHKWYMNDRLVESPHIASFYARSESQALQEASKYWCVTVIIPTPSTVYTLT